MQSPLQPLADNLESATYEVFEKDSIKYDLYEESLFKALCDLRDYGRFYQTKGCLGPQYLYYNNFRQEQPMEEIRDPNSPITILYFGAGRGPLIRRALSAARRANVNDRVQVIALDKNPNAIITIRNMIIDEHLENQVKLIAGDMRSLKVSELQGDILMSELLGSFGDNELSPECLIPTEKYLKPGGIYFPWSYTN